MLIRMDHAQVVGRNVQRLRLANGLSLAELAAAGGVSKTTLHGIEQGDGNPTLSTLWALATALGTPLGSLIDPPAATVEVVRADEGAQAEGEAVRARLLHRIRLHGTVEVYDIDVAGTRQRSEPHLAGVEECMVVTEGHITTGPDDAPADLATGDSIRFDAARPHQYRGHAPHNRAVLLMLHPD